MVQVISLKNGSLSARILPLGATLSRLRLGTRDLVLGFEDAAQHHAVPIYAGHLVGPVANRVSAGHLVIEGKPYQMERNENGRTTLHSGSSALHSLPWDIAEQTATMVRLHCNLADGFGGLPGHRSVTATYRLSSDALRLDIQATTTKTTPMNIAHHPYWALDRDMQRTRLWVDATRYLEKRADNTPNGQIKDVTGTALDFTTARPVPLKKDIDHCLCLSPSSDETPRHVATLTSADGLEVRIDTTEAGLQVYNGAGIPERRDITAVPHGLRCFAGLALEPQGWPDAPNHPHFPGIYLKSGETYAQSTCYRISQT